MGFKPSRIWMKKTKTGKGVIFVLNDKFYTTSVRNIQRLLEDEIKAVNFSETTEEVQTEIPE